MHFYLGLTGHPLGHSLSPQIHRAALDACGLKGKYSLFPIAPDNRHGLKELLTRVRAGELHGLNVTIPHKETAIPLLDALTPTAEAIGAVNTIFMQNGKLTGDNTDAPGFLADLERFLKGLEITNRKSALVFGAGGSARAVIYALINDGWKITIAARRREQANKLAYRNINHISITDFNHLSSFILPTSSFIIVNTTPLGMSPHVNASPWPADLPFPPNVAVYDLVYNPRETTLVKDARAAGLPATTGLGMLIEQAALAFEIWTGCNPPRKVLWKTLDDRK